ncbi:hypothetical protein Pse7429DRAFT_1810 [Pseudanabaena biceps PCC 7429]|uniref:Uncharacterized protein n=1 Tax=Pseudanabaena biceps PCC 7429 TaxID=927668 RepID=L8N1G1_9CYAN|nr:hypothetical protein Pse7429DRAFT_1810 [Pseudanabaena biceps PCC 7429]
MCDQEPWYVVPITLANQCSYVAAKSAEEKVGAKRQPSLHFIARLATIKKIAGNGNVSKSTPR